MSYLLVGAASLTDLPTFLWRVKSFVRISLTDHLFNFWCISFMDIFWLMLHSSCFGVLLCQDMASKCGSSFDFSAFFHFKSLDGAFYRFHLWHRVAPVENSLKPPKASFGGL